MSQDQSAPKLHTHVVLKKFDHEVADEPVLIEEVTLDDGVVTDRKTFPPPK